MTAKTTRSKSKPKTGNKTMSLLAIDSKKTSSDLVRDDSHKGIVEARATYRIHAHAQRLRDNRENRERYKHDDYTRSDVVVVHSTADKRHAAIFHEVHILGQSRIVHKPSEPLSGTDGRAVCWIETEADIVVVYSEGGRPETLTQEIWDRRKIDVEFLANC